LRLARAKRHNIPEDSILLTFLTAISSPMLPLILRTFSERQGP
jgi:hypothetical protein